MDHLRVTSYKCKAVLLSDLIGLVICNSYKFILSDDDRGLLDRPNLDFDNAFVPSVRKDDTFVGRSVRCLAILWNRFCEVKI